MDDYMANMGVSLPGQHQIWKEWDILWGKLERSSTNSSEVEVQTLEGMTTSHKGNMTPETCGEGNFPNTLMHKRGEGTMSSFWHACLQLKGWWRPSCNGMHGKIRLPRREGSLHSFLNRGKDHFCISNSYGGDSIKITRFYMCGFMMVSYPKCMVGGYSYNSFQLNSKNVKR